MALNFLEECLDIDACLKRAASSNQYAVAVSRQYTQSIISKSQLFCFDHFENLYSYSVSFWIRKDLYMTNDINGVIKGMIKNGLVLKWIRDHKTHSPEMSIINTDVLTLEEMMGAMAICVLNLLAAITVAVLEQVIYRKTKKQSAHRYWILASKFIDSDRYLSKIDSELLNGQY